jgi:hypothetical protein
MKRLRLGVAAAGLILAFGLVDTASARVVGFRGGVGIGRVGFARPGLGVGIGRVGFVRPGLGWRAGWGGWGVRRGWGWGWPVAAGIAAGVATAGWGYGSSCLAWNGYGWVNVCYTPYPYTYW